MIKEKNFKILYYNFEIFFQIIIYLIPSVVIKLLLIFNKKNYFRLINFYHIYDLYDEKAISYDNIYLKESAKDFSLNLKSISIDSSFQFFSNIKLIFFSLKYNNPTIIFRSDYASYRTYVDLGAIYVLVKFFNVNILPISNDTNWLKNNFRCYFFLKISEYIYIEDRNLFISKNFKIRCCSLNLTKEMFKIEKKFEDRKINVLFVGRMKNMEERNKIINYLIKKNIKIHLANKDKKYLNRKEYFNLLQNSKILINFNRAPKSNKIHFVGRATHAIASGCMVLEPHFTHLDRKFLTSNQDFVTYINPDDLIDKIKFYEKNINLANQISQNGNKNLLKLYNETHVWKLLIEKSILNFHNAVF